MEIRARNVNEMLSEALWQFRVSGVEVNTRNGEALVILEPVILTYFNSNIANYSDDGVRFNAPYGERMRYTFSIDQIYSVIDVLRKDPETRQAVVQLWHPSDLMKATKDKACNMSVVFSVHPISGYLDMTVFNRSNDLWWGTCGANAVQFSILQELVASSLKRPVGTYRQITNNLHLYKNVYNVMDCVNSPSLVEGCDEYKHADPAIDITPLTEGVNHLEFLYECSQFCNDPFSQPNGDSEFLRHVAYPMAMVSHERKQGGDGLRWCERILADDWGIATTGWAQRRETAREEAAK